MRRSRLWRFYFGFPPFEFYYHGRVKPMPNKEEYLQMLEEYRVDLEEEIKELDREIEEMKNDHEDAGPDTHKES